MTMAFWSVVLVSLAQLEGEPGEGPGVSEDAGAQAVTISLEDAVDAGELPSWALGPKGLPVVQTPPPDEWPRMRPELPVKCGSLTPSKAVPSGEYRIQCDEQAKVCVVSANTELDEDGVESVEPLQRSMSCYGYEQIDYGQLARQGYRFVLGVADAPPGWERDERGRVLQVNFDLHRRVYLGGAYGFVAMPSGSPARARADFGVDIEWPGDERPKILHRLHLLETELNLGPRTEIDATFLRYDWSHDRRSPFLRVTTFFGKPRRGDLDLDAGGYFELLRLESLQWSGERATFMTWLAAHLTIDLWHSADLINYVRVRGGPGIEYDTVNKVHAFKPAAALEADFTLDRDGFHHLTFQAQAEKLLFAPAVLGRPRSPQRLSVKAGYEVIFLAVNDQPLTLVLDARTQYRDDIQSIPAQWEVTANAGLRFSFWAPARRTAEELEAP